MNTPPPNPALNDDQAASAATRRLLQHSLLLMGATQIGNVANLFFQIIMMRRLPGAEYGALATMLALTAILSYPMTALRTTAAYFTALLYRQGRRDAAVRLRKAWLHRMILLCALVLAGGFMSLAWAADFLQLPSTALIRATLLLVAASLFLPMLQGFLQGMESFGWLAFSMPALGVGRLLAGLALTEWVAATAMAAIFAQIIGMLAASGMALAGLRGGGPANPAGRPPPPDMPVRQYIFGSFIILLGFSIMQNADIVLVKIFFTPETAGTFARAANAARMVVFLPLPIALAMFPKVVSPGNRPAAHQWQTLRVALFCTTALVLAAALTCTLAAGFLWRIFNGQPGAPAEIAMLRRLLWALAPLGISFLLLQFELARRRFRSLWMLGGMAGLYLAGAAQWHAHPGQIILLLAIINTATMLLLAGGMKLGAGRRPGDAD